MSVWTVSLHMYSTSFAQDRYTSYKTINKMSKTPVLTSNAPKPLPGIYSQAIIANGTVYCSGAVAMDAETGKIVDGDIKVSRENSSRGCRCCKMLITVF